MSTLTEIEDAVVRLSPAEQAALLAFVAQKLGETSAQPAVRAGLRASLRPPLQGLPADLSTGTRERVRDLVAKRDAANR